MGRVEINEEVIFDLARRIEDANTRKDYVEQACAGDPAIQARVIELLNHHDAEQSFLERPPEGLTLTLDGNEVTEKPGESVGPYKLREKIGEGGMGVVYAAEQERPIRRKVAIKVIKPGMDSRAVLARFEAEQQALAIMNHRNIAKVLDAGIADSGRPYFVMELVSGIPITEYCDENQMSIEERLTLFIQVCRAIQHAHQKGIIHRDIKPSNVLVTEEDGESIPKVIDFGVAKALSQRLTNRSLYTSFQAFVGTPLYASPEQASLSNVDVDTRSDVYSLGVLLYELITGTTPHDKKQVQQAAYAEMCRIIREQLPVSPSARLSTLGDTATEVSKRRRSDPTRLVQSIRGDLDCIVMKALEQDRSRRYEGASGLAADVGRFLKHEAIEARPPSFTYRLGRVIARNKMLAASGLVVAVAIAMVLAAGLVAMRENFLKNQIVKKLKATSLEVAFEDAFTGSFQAFNESFAIARAAGISLDWLETLRGVNLFHNGDNLAAIQRFDAALTINPDNTSAWALKAVALIDEGDFYNWTQHIRSYEDYQPRPEFKAIDKLCLAYATYHVNLDDALERLEEVLQEHPTWTMARAIYAGALAENGDIKGDSGSINQAILEASVARHITPENPFAQLAYVFTHNTAVRNRIGDTQFLLDEAEPVVAQLIENEDYALGNAFAADYYRLQNQMVPSEYARSKELQLWRRVAEGKGNFASRAFAELYRAGLANEVLSASPTDPEAEIARGFVLTQDLYRSDEAKRLLEEYRMRFDSWYMRLELLKLQLLLKDEGGAIELCKQWLGSEALQQRDQYDPFLEQLVRCLSESRLDSLETEIPWQEFQKQFFLALQSYANSHISEARKQMEYCVNHPSLSSADHWARAFYERWDAE